MPNKKNDQKKKIDLPIYVLQNKNDEHYPQILSWFQEFKTVKIIKNVNPKSNSNINSQASRKIGNAMMTCRNISPENIDQLKNSRSDLLEQMRLSDCINPKVWKLSMGNGDTNESSQNIECFILPLNENLAKTKNMMINHLNNCIEQECIDKIIGENFKYSKVNVNSLRGK